MSEKAEPLADTGWMKGTALCYHGDHLGMCAQGANRILGLRGSVRMLRIRAYAKPKKGRREIWCRQKLFRCDPPGWRCDFARVKYGVTDGNRALDRLAKQRLSKYAGDRMWFPLYVSVETKP